MLYLFYVTTYYALDYVYGYQSLHRNLYLYCKLCDFLKINKIANCLWKYFIKTSISKYIIEIHYIAWHIFQCVTFSLSLADFPLYMYVYTLRVRKSLYIQCKSITNSIEIRGSLFQRKLIDNLHYYTTTYSLLRVFLMKYNNYTGCVSKVAQPYTFFISPDKKNGDLVC